ncbi:MAG: cache domain-containing protein [Desulfoprunum sp.]|nr:cache domain-containing protein [Desulfoprunum sp.]
MNIKIRKSIIIMTVLSGVVLAAVAINYRITQHIVEKTIIAQQQDLAAKAASTVELWLNQQMKILDATAASVPSDLLGRNEMTMGPLKMAMKAGHFSDVYIGESTGMLIDGADWLPPPGYDPRVRPWYRRAVETGTISFTTPYIDMVTNKLVIALVKPLLRGGKLRGVMGADTVLDTLVNNVLNLKVSKTGYAFLVERSGTILVHPIKDYVMRANLQTIEPDLAGKLNVFKENNEGTMLYLSGSGEKNIFSYRLIAGSDWFLCITVPYVEAYSLTRETTMIFAMEIVLRILGILALIALVGLGGSGLVLFMFSKRYSSAVQQHQVQMIDINKDLEWNITKRKEVETYYQTLFNVANDAILISKGLQHTECNHKAEEIFGLSREEILEKTMLDLSPAYQPDGSLSSECISRIIENSREGEQQFFRWSFSRSDGTEFPASVNLKIFTLNNEELTLSSIRDISKRVDAEGQLMQAQKLAAVGEMLGAIAHQWRQPLNTLATYISSLEAAQYNNLLSKPFVDKLVSGANGQIQFMSKTIDDFRNFFRPAKKKGPVDVFGVLISAVKLMEAQMKHGNIILSVKNQAGSDALVVLGYQGEFVHVLVNILANARDAILESRQDEGDGTAQTIDIIVASREDEVIIDIIDSGCGIPEHLLPQIFNPYYTTKGASSGTGMGLYMSKMIVEKEMGGELLAANTTTGAQFTIKLKKMATDSVQ